MALFVDKERCDGCGTCVEACPNEAITLLMGMAKINEELCTSCETCVSLCPVEAIKVEYEPAAVQQNATQPEISIMTSTAGRRNSIEPTVRVIRVPGPAAIQGNRPSLTKQLGTALAFMGREIIPCVLDRLATTLEQRLTSPSTGASVPSVQTAENSGSNRIGQGSQSRRRKRIRRGRY